jgi:hypothetical protein
MQIFAFNFSINIDMNIRWSLNVTLRKRSIRMFGNLYSEPLLSFPGNKLPKKNHFLLESAKALYVRQIGCEDPFPPRVVNQQTTHFQILESNFSPPPNLCVAGNRSHFQVLISFCGRKTKQTKFSAKKLQSPSLTKKI